MDKKKKSTERATKSSAKRMVKQVIYGKEIKNNPLGILIAAAQPIAREGR